nr:dynein axonemal assembly factor 1 homolog [Drosophila takahashii]
MSQGTAVVAPRREITGLNRMTAKGLKELCKKDKLYQTPRLNDVLYLHYQGYQCIECLEEYTELKCLWLECNAISEIQGLEQLTKLKCLFLQNNLITKIENLNPCRELDTLNLSSNHIRKIQNIGSDILPVLNTLNISSNYLKDSESLSDLVQCKALSVLDLSNNRIDDILIVKVFEQMPSLRVLVLQGNPVVSRLPQYRKTLILSCKELTYLDSRPVFPRDRACAEAWKREGYEGERKENNRWNRAERRKTRDSVNCTIRMRNRFRPPDQQDPLLKSSDSEDDTVAEKSRKRAEIENGGGDDLWDEVSGEQESSEHSNSTASSGEDNEGAGSQDDHAAEKLSNRKPLEGRPKNLYETELCNAEEAKLEDLNISREIIDNDGRDVAIEDSTMDKHEEIIEKSRGENIKKSTEEELTEKASEQISAIENINPEEVFENQHLTKSNEDIIDSSSELDEDLEQTCQTLTLIAQNNDLIEDETHKEFKSKVIDDMYKSFEGYIDNELDEPLDLILNDDTTNYKPEDRFFCEENKTPRDFYQDDAEPCFTPKSKEQLELELDCAIVNDKCAHDLEEMGSQIDEDLEELRQFNQNLIGPIKDETNQTDTESEEEDLADQQEAKSPLLTQQFEERRKQMKLREELKRKEEESLKNLNTTPLEESVAEDGPDELFAKILDDATDNVPKRIFGSGYDAPSQDWPEEECMRQLALSETSVQEEVFTRPITNMTSAEEAEEICRQMDQKLAQDEEALRKLLQDLEDEADETYEIETKVEYEKIITIEEPNVASICSSLLDDIIVQLTFDEIVPVEKPKSFEFGPIESDEEFSYSTEPQLEKLVPPELEDPARGKSLRECLDTFSDFVTSMADPKLPCLLGRNPTAGVEKIRAAQELLKSKNLEEFTKDTAESLDAQIDKETERRKKRVAASAARCFNQREKYEDTLEVVNNRLMVVKKDTGELEELPPPPDLISDTESDDYDTAEEDYSSGKGPGQDVRRPWTTPYKPKPRKSDENLVIEAMQQSQKESESPEDGPDDGQENDTAEDEFHSLEAMTTFGNLDCEFFQKLDLQRVSEDDDAESAIECMRSYNELKAYMKAGSQEPQLTSEENEMMQSMLPKEEIKPSNPQRDEEDDLLKKMVIRMKEIEERERQLQPPPIETPKEPVSINLSLGGSTIFEQKSELLDLEYKTDSHLESKKSETSADPLVKVPRASPNKSIDDDIQSDASTDYESGEEVGVVEPPKLPKEVLKSFYSEGFESDQKMVHDLQEATRRTLYRHSTEQIKPGTSSHLKSNLMPGFVSQGNPMKMKSNRSECSIRAREKWGKIAERLSEFLDPETIAMLNSQEFGDSDEDEDDEDENDQSDLAFISEDTEMIKENILGNQEKLLVLDEPKTDNGNACISEGKDSEQIEKQDTNKNDNEKVISNQEVKSESKEMESSLAQDTVIGNIENILICDENIASEETGEVNPTERFTIDYFEDPEPTEIEIDGVKPECLKTEQIHCNLEVLSEDGDVVVKEVSVSAQVTFK